MSKMPELNCPHCGAALIALQLKEPLPSGHTHQCSDCGALAAPFGLDDGR